MYLTCLAARLLLASLRFPVLCLQLLTSAFLLPNISLLALAELREVALRAQSLPSCLGSGALSRTHVAHWNVGVPARLGSR